MGRKSPRAGFSISTEATLPRLPQRQTWGTSMPHQLDRRPAEGLARGVIQSRRQERGRAPPVAKVLRRQPGQQGMVRHARKDLPQAVLGDAEAQPFLQGFRGLFEDEDFQPVADAAEVRRRPVHRQRALADDEDIVTGQVRAGLDRHGLSMPHRLSASAAVSPFGIERAPFLMRRPLASAAVQPAAGSTSIVKLILLRLAVAEAHVGVECILAPAATSRAAQSCSGIRSCCPVAIVAFCAAHGSGQPAERPPAVGSHRLPRVVDDDDLLLDRFARVEIVVLAGEGRGLAGDVGQQRPVVAQDGLPVGRRAPSRKAGRPGPCVHTARRYSPG